MERRPQFTNDGVRHATINGHRFHLKIDGQGKHSHLWIKRQTTSFTTR